MGDESEYEGGANPRGRSGDLGSVYDIGAPLEAALAYHHGELSRRTVGGPSEPRFLPRKCGVFFASVLI